MHVRTLIVSLSLVALCGITVQAQYKEMSKVESLAKSSNEQQMLSELSSHLGVPADSLKKEMTANNLNFGQLYLANEIAKESKSDVSGILSDSKSKTWGEIAKDRKVDLKKISADESEFEKSVKNEKTGGK